MDTTTVIIIAAVVVIALVCAVIWVLLRKRTEDRRVEAAGIRDQAAEQSFKVGQREALADETAARGRAAQAESDAKAAEAERLQHRAHAHSSEAASSRDELKQEWERADKIDPDSESRDTPQGADPDHQSHRDDRA